MYPEESEMAASPSDARSFFGVATDRNISTTELTAMRRTIRWQLCEHHPTIRITIVFIEDDENQRAVGTVGGHSISVGITPC